MISNWVTDLLDQWADVRDQIWQLEQDLNRKKEEMEQFKVENERLEALGLGQRSGHAGPVAPCRVPGQPLPKGASAEPRTPKKNGKLKPRRQPGLPSEEKQEYCKSLLVLTLFWCY